MILTSLTLCEVVLSYYIYNMFLKPGNVGDPPLKASISPELFIIRYIIVYQDIAKYTVWLKSRAYILET